MDTPHTAHSAMPAEIPSNFFEGLPEGTPPPATLPRALPGDETRPTAPLRALMLYDAIIDDILSNPGGTLVDTAKRLKKASGTISLVVRSDFFKARWLQRRDQFNAEMHARLTRKMASVAEQSLDLTARVLKQKGESIPLPQLDAINKNILDRLGYAPQPSGGVNVNVNAASVAQATAPSSSVSAAALASARENLRKLEAMNAASRPGPGPSQASRDASAGGSGPVVEGEATRLGDL